MTIYVHGISALPMLYESSANLPRSAATSLRGCTARVAEGSREDLLIRRLGAEARPLHLLVDTAEKRHRVPSIASHVLTHPVPRGSFLKHSDELFIASPELCFVQLAKDLDIVDTVRLGYELCGQYLMGEDCIGGFTEARPLTTPEKLRKFIDKADGIPGVFTARRAVRWVRANSKSPRETALSMLLGLHTKYGGWQFGDHLLNYELDVGVDVEGRMRRFIDLYWPKARVGVEYDSHSFHTGREKISHDSVREKVIESRGIDLMRVTSEELVDPLKQNLFIELLAHKIGVRLRNSSSEVRRHRRALASRLAKQEPLF